MSVIFNHARRYDLFDRNPISMVRQSAKRRTFPEVLSVDEIQQLVAALKPRERTLVLLAAGTGLRMSELFALKWKDIDFVRTEMSVTRSIVNQVVGRCKTEASQKPVPLDARLAQALQDWFQQAKQYLCRSPIPSRPLSTSCGLHYGATISFMKNHSLDVR
jgi:integrase